MRTAIAAFPETMHESTRTALVRESVTTIDQAFEIFQKHGYLATLDDDIANRLIGAARTTLTLVLSAPPGENEGKKRGRPKGSKNKS